MNSPYLKLKVNIKKLSIIKFSNKDSNFRNNIIYSTKNFKIKSKKFNNFQVVLIGNPIIEDENTFFLNLNKNKQNIEYLKKKLKTINGQFLIVLNFYKDNKLFIINDRFASIPIYYFKHKHNIYLSHLYHDLNFIDHVKKQKIDSLAFLQVLFFNRMFGDYTFHKKIKYLIPASIYFNGEKKTNLVKYWFPNFNNKILKFNSDVGKKYIQLLKESADRNLKGFKKNEIGVFLSGGHDSRSICLVVKNKNPITLSVSFKKNYEIKVAKKVSKTLNLKNKFIKLDKAHFERNLKTITRINSGFYGIFDALFVGLNKKIPKNIKLLIHGHGLDYMFQGMYIPHDWIKLFNRPTFFKKSVNLEKVDLVNFFINNISYRVKGIDLYEIVKPKYRGLVRKYIFKTINQIYLVSKKSSLNKYDNWEYIMSDTLSRHYSYPNVLSTLSLKNQKTLSFDNELYDFYLSLDHRVRLKSECMRYLLNNINRNVGKIETGNWGLPGNDGPFSKTYKLILRKIKRHITLNQKFKAPTSSDRTWPTRGDYLRKSEYFKNILIEINNSSNFKKILYYFDWDKIDKLKEDFLYNDNNKSDNFFTILITLYLFLKEIRRI